LSGACGGPRAPVPRRARDQREREVPAPVRLVEEAEEILRRRRVEALDREQLGVQLLEQDGRGPVHILYGNESGLDPFFGKIEKRLFGLIQDLLGRFSLVKTFGHDSIRGTDHLPQRTKSDCHRGKVH
jgi:hypothetical protein